MKSDFLLITQLNPCKTSQAKRFRYEQLVGVAINNQRVLVYIQFLTNPQNLIQRVRVHLLAPIKG